MSEKYSKLINFSYDYGAEVGKSSKTFTDVFTLALILKLLGLIPNVSWTIVTSPLWIYWGGTTIIGIIAWIALFLKIWYTHEISVIKPDKDGWHHVKPSHAERNASLGLDPEGWPLDLKTKGKNNANANEYEKESSEEEA